MTKYFSLACILLAFNSFGQKNKNPDQPFPMPLVDSQVVYTNIITVDGVSKDELYKRARLFIVKNYKSANAVIQLDDKESGHIIGKGVLTVVTDGGDLLGASETKVNHTISIMVKDGRYKYEVSDLSVIGQLGSTQTTTPMEYYITSKNKFQKRFSVDAHTYISIFVQSLIDAMNTKVKDDW